ncbi:MAG: hypothetical protein KDC14_13010 [Planctomycetes bacterium]|nr:hypothetical protein [Planctomycetota bacterium]
MRSLMNVALLCALLLVLLAAVSAAASPLLFGNSDACKGSAKYVGGTPAWVIACTGSGCGANGNRPCSTGSGGVPGAYFTYCGCPNDPNTNPDTPICCYATVDSQTGLPSSNGFCKGQTLASDHCEPPPCSLLSPSETERVGACVGE